MIDPGVVVLLIVVVLFVFILGSMSIRIIRPFQRGLVERLGRFHNRRDPGLNIIIPFIETLVKIDLRERVIDVPAQSIITKDNVVVEVDALIYCQVTDPFKTESGRPPLTPGMFVRVDIEGRPIKDIYRLPRYAIRRGAEVWVAAGTGETKKLTVQPVEIVRMDRDFAYVATGLDEGDFVITSALETVTNGMAIRVIVSDEAKNQ